MFRLLTAIVLLLIVAVAAGIAATLWWSLPASHQDATVAGLSAPVDIRIDQDGVPRIRAANAADAAAALGFVHARDRMFQMDMMRRTAEGRLSERLGRATLPLDRMMRVLGLRRRAEIDLASLSPQARAVLEAYARGVNAWIAARGRFSAPEFVVLGAPEAWDVVDSLMWGKLMGLWLSANWRTELARLSVAGKVSSAMLDELWPPDGAVMRPDASLTAPEPNRGAETKLAGLAGRLLSSLPVFPGSFTQPPSASNEWAVDGSRSATGAPLLAGDPHLGFGLPAIWYLARIDTPAGVLAGATAPGVPFLVMGHNGRIAWTFTTTGADVQDVFIETPTGDGRYLTPDGPRDFAVRQERIRIRGSQPEILTVRETRHGPVISDLDPTRQDGQPGPVLAVAMTNLAASDTAAAGLQALNDAGDIDEAARAASRITSPVQNLLVADRTRIALYVTGRVPVRRSGDGRAPVAGATGEFDWIGIAQGGQLPRIVAPASGRLVNANERVAPANFPIFMGHDWFADWRARRIRALLEATDQHSVEGFAAMQMDTRSAFAEQILPALRATRPPAGLAARALALLADWDGTMAADRPQPLIFNMWVDRFGALMLRRMGIPAAAAGPLHESVAYALGPNGAKLCGGDCAPLLREALVEATATLAAAHGDDPAAWRWGETHRAVFAHPLLRLVPLLGRLTTIRVPVPGDDSTLDRQGGGGPDFASVHGASYRGVYDLADLDRSRFVIAPGQSGHPLSRHSRDFISRWRDGGTVTLGALPDRVSATIRLTPNPRTSPP